MLLSLGNKLISEHPYTQTQANMMIVVSWCEKAACHIGDLCLARERRREGERKRMRRASSRLGTAVGHSP